MNLKINKIYILIFTYIILIFAYRFKDINFEIQDFDAINRILNPKLPKGSLKYDFQHNYNYINAFLINFFNLNITLMPKIFWFFERLLTVFAIYKICNFFLKANKNFFILTIFLYLSLKSGETDQKTLALPIILFSFYFILIDKYKLAGLFAGFIFYFHIGSAVWWSVPSTIFLFYVALNNQNKKNIFNFLSYLIVTILVSIPVLYFYIFIQDLNFTKNDFFKNYWYGINNSFVYYFKYNINGVFPYITNLLVFILGYLICSRRNENFQSIKLLYIFLSLIFLLFINHIFVDYLFNGIVIKLQLLRSLDILYFFNLLFLSFILCKQIERSNYFFLIIFFISIIPNPIFIIYKLISFWNYIHILFIFLLLYEALYFYRKKKIIFNKDKFFYKTISKLNVLQKSFNLIIFIVFLTTLSNLNFFLKLDEKLIKIFFKENSETKNFIYEKESLSEILDFIDTQISNPDSILLIPMTNGDLRYLTKQKTFIDRGTLLDYYPKNADIFEKVFTNDFNYAPIDLHDEASWIEIWNNVDQKQILKWKNEYGITHVVREVELPLSFKIIFTNNKFIVYQL